MRCSKLMFAATILFMISTVLALTSQQQTEKNTGSLPFSKVRVIVSFYKTLNVISRSEEQVQLFLFFGYKLFANI